MRLKFWEKRNPNAQTMAHVAQSTPPHVHRVLKAFDLRQGMWVVYRGRTGIVTGVSDGLDGHARVMLTDAQLGLNQEEVTVSVTELRQARHAEIPEGRRPHPEHGARLGYH